MDTSKSNTYIALSSKGRKFEFEISEKQIRFRKKILNISVETAKDGFTYVILGKKRYPVHVVNSNQNKYEVMINNVTYDISVETPISFKRKEILEKQKPESKTLTIASPMPGKIIEVFAEEGNQINEGDALLILEAMKMQNEITSHTSGKVKKVFIKPGDVVNKEDLLVEIEK